MQIEHGMSVSGKGMKLKRKSENLVGYVCIAPWLIGFVLLTLTPTIVTILLSFTKYDILSPPKFVGLDNFKSIFFSDEKFLKAVKATFYYVFGSVPLRLVFALFVAMLLYRGSRVVSVYRVVYYFPSIIGGSVAVAVMWRQLFGINGAVNGILSLLLGTDIKMSWLMNPNTAIWTIIVLAMWQFGSSMLIFLAGLKQIPISLFDSSVIDGANAIQKFFKITIPMLTPVIFFNLVMQIISGFQTFTQGYIVTMGRPYDTTLLYAMYLYDKSFSYFSMGYGCALAWILLIIIALLSSAVFKSSSYWVYYETKENM